ncbi:hypothetical protein Mterra_00251 [Calidithermus terrae]|uniref:Uncharacterized protein n=2 Tax=Calidithermus terrae TaxID=1408545 RepID=A0A399F5U9_9DEIN|nr:hypothetical protein Mterra_00251 [Calidithermus terrae]
MEPLPRGMDLKEWQLRKIRFDIPGMNWTDRKFRVLYFYNPQTHTVVLARAYTHAEFEGRPSDEEIRAAYDEARLASSS